MSYQRIRKENKEKNTAKIQGMCTFVSEINSYQKSELFVCNVEGNEIISSQTVLNCIIFSNHDSRTLNFF